MQLRNGLYKILFNYRSVVIASAVFALAGTARAVTSGWVWRGDYQVPTVGCAAAYHEAAVDVGNGVMYFFAKLTTTQCVPYGASVPLPAGWLGADVGAYRDGGFCGETGFYYTWNTSSLIIQDGADMCGKPPGLHAYNSDSYGKIWNGSGYTSTGLQVSPSMNYTW